MAPTGYRRAPLARTFGLGLILVLAATACGMHDAAEDGSYGADVSTPPRYTDGAGGAANSVRAIERATRRAERAQARQQAEPIEIVPRALPRPASQMGFAWPVSGRVTSPFGWRIDPITDARSFHHGMDIGCWAGQTIHASKGGRVLFAGRARVYGNVVALLHGHGLITVYGHMGSLAVEHGSRVAQGATLGICGSSGRSTGPHLHLEIRHGSTVYDPAGFLP